MAKEFIKVEDLIVKFKEIGDLVEGKLVSVEDGRSFGNKVYKIDSKGKTYTVFGTSVLESQMVGVSIGDEVRILFAGTKPSKTKGYEDIKLFEVYVRKQ